MSRPHKRPGATALRERQQRALDRLRELPQERIFDSRIQYEMSVLQMRILGKEKRRS